MGNSESIDDTELKLKVYKFVTINELIININRLKTILIQRDLEYFLCQIPLCINIDQEWGKWIITNSFKYIPKNFNYMAYTFWTEKLENVKIGISKEHYQFLMNIKEN